MVVVATAGCGDDGPAGPEPGSDVIAGSVTRQKTGVGVRDVVAVLIGGGRVVMTTHTDADGRFAFGSIDPGEYTVRLTGLDIAGLDSRFDVLEPESRLAQSPSAEDLVFAVVGLVAPRVTGELRCGGAPIGGASVRVIGGSSDRTATTDALGRYAVLDLEPGNYAVIPVAAPCPVSPSFRAIELRPGQSGEADFEG
jgi:hypothetical protein